MKESHREGVASHPDPEPCGCTREGAAAHLDALAHERADDGRQQPRGAADYWKLSEPGMCLMHARVGHGYNEWIPSPLKRHRYLIEAMPPAEVGKAIEDLMIAPPRGK